MEQIQSSEIGKLIEALSKAQGALQGAEKDGSNPFHKSSYPTLSSIWEACRKPLSENGLAIIQTVEKQLEKDCLVTMLAHSSGQWIKSYIPLFPVKYDSQSMGSAITYSRRYALAAMVGICPADDDGEAAMGRGDDHSYESKPVYEKREFPDGKKVTPKQASFLLTLLNRLNDANHFKKILNDYGISKIEELEMNKFQEVLDSVQEKINSKVA